MKFVWFLSQFSDFRKMSLHSDDTSESWSFVSSAEERAQMILADELEGDQSFTYERNLFENSKFDGKI